MLGIFLLTTGCSQTAPVRPATLSSDFHPEVESGQFAIPQSYRTELQGETRWEQLEKQTLTVSHEKQSKIATELDATLAKEIAQEQQQSLELSEKNQQLQRELHNFTRLKPRSIFVPQ